MMLVGLAVDAVCGWPRRIYAAIGHPVTWLGRLIDALDARWNHGTRRQRLASGFATVGVVLFVAVVPAILLQSLLPAGPAGWILGGLLAWPMIAARSLHQHVAAVADPLGNGDLEGARAAVAMIVGRDPATLDEAAIARASIESLAENTSDGVFAPLFWGAVAGLPGLVAYKAINTLDSMIGHRSARYEAFGKVAARLDDVVNWVPARLTGLVFALAAGREAVRSLGVMVRDAHRHRSPNAGWPESAVAGALGIRLSGPRSYGDREVAEPWLNEAAPDPEPADIRLALALYRRAVALMAAILLCLALL